MSEPRLVVVRHGDTEWSQNGRHTSRTDLPLLPVGGRTCPFAVAPVLAEFDVRARAVESAAARPAARLSSPASVTALEIDARSDRVGLRRLRGPDDPADPRAGPRLEPVADGCPGGESPADVSARVDRVIADAVKSDGDVLMFAHGHILRRSRRAGLASRSPLGGRFALMPATISVLGHEHESRVIERWNVPAG